MQIKLIKKKKKKKKKKSSPQRAWRNFLLMNKSAWKKFVESEVAGDHISADEECD